MKGCVHREDNIEDPMEELDQGEHYSDGGGCLCDCWTSNRLSCVVMTRFLKFVKPQNGIFYISVFTMSPTY